jgi:hypothetical protein
VIEEGERIDYPIGDESIIQVVHDRLDPLDLFF